ncbi:metallophosphoesterase [Ottowia flava]|uniref:Metallophosphoesterase n=1 Tax=Ottowia flava TaxID=2675430 RepID=A0ABW4KYJ0_9BURK|nr:metallophosphoesterase [Ottowia sp. GY511]
MLIAHITDPHLGLDTRFLPGHPGPQEALRRALSHVRKLDPAPEVLLITGDLADSGAESDYDTLRTVLADTLPSPADGGPRVWAVLGNHDDRAAARRILGEMLDPAADAPEGLICLHTQHGGLHFIGLDTVVPRRPHGELDDTQLNWLARQLQACAGEPVVIFMHHPPLVSGMEVMDRCGLLRGREQLGALVRAHGNVQLIAAGHLHRPVVGLLGGAPVLVEPSCSHQLELDLRTHGQLAVRLEPPKVGLYRWTPEDGLACHFSHVHAYPGPFVI